jgi:hypothetical protein
LAETAGALDALGEGSGSAPAPSVTGVTEYRRTTCPDRVPRLSRRSSSSLSDMGPTGPVPKLGILMVAQPGNAATEGPATSVATIRDTEHSTATPARRPRSLFAVGGAAHRASRSR